jgi:hypothetical protein
MHDALESCAGGGCFCTQLDRTVGWSFGAALLVFLAPISLARLAAVGWRRGAEYWVPPATWHDIFENDEDAAVFGAQTLRDNGLQNTIRSSQPTMLRENQERGNALLLRLAACATNF